MNRAALRVAAFCAALFLVACGAEAPGAGATVTSVPRPTSQPTVGSASAGATVIMGQGPGPVGTAPAAATQTPIAALPGLSPAQLKYRLIDQLGQPFFCARSISAGMSTDRFGAPLA